jgi:pyruvate carboxylase
MISKLNIKVGDKVEENQVLAVVEAMKMEINIASRMSGVVSEVLVAAGQSVKAGELLAIIK